MQLSTSPCDNKAVLKRGSGFTLVQVLLVIAVLGLLASILVGQFGRGRASVRRVECDVHLKEIAMALDTFRQETGRMPATLAEFQQKRYIESDSLRCAADPNLAVRGQDPSYTSYGDFYVIREPRDSGEMPVVVCPFHEGDGSHGAQAFKGGYTNQYAARPATLAVGDFAGVVTVERPGKGVLALPTSSPLQLRGGDRIRTGAGEATIRFVDGSNANITANSEMSVMQSYRNGRRGGPLFTLVRQFSGRVNYYVKPGNNFDVATPTATAGALGTRFSVNLAASPNVPIGQLDSFLTVQEHTVAFTTLERTVNISAIPGELPVTVAANDPVLDNRPRRPRNGRANGLGSTGGGNN
ncbi:MAG: FecR domain-containing protein [Armatimonadetes bacterium]|nr:FecR domain-containing protein [Armatimonadota bacterium]